MLRHHMPVGTAGQIFSPIPRRGASMRAWARPGFQNNEAFLIFPLNEAMPQRYVSKLGTMTPAQVAEAQKFAREWKPKPER